MVIGAMMTSTIVFGQTVIPGGDVSGVWGAAGSPYLIEGDITVPSEEELAIEAGVEIIFQGYYKLTVNGVLEAVGTQSDSVLFTAADTVEGWKGIRFPSTPNSGYLSFCTIQFGRATGQEPDCHGGAIYCWGTILEISSCTIQKNSATNGGGIYCFCSYININSCTISENSAKTGGGIYLNTCNLGSSAFTDCHITENIADSLGGGVFCTGGVPPFMNCTISENTAGSGGGIYCWLYGYLSMSHCTISENMAIRSAGFGGFGGGICLQSGSSAISYCTIQNNVSETWGGGIYCNSTTLDINYTTVCGNSALYPSLGGRGGGLNCQGSTVTINHCTLHGNIAEGYGGGIYISLSDLTLKNIILEGNTWGGVYFISYYSVEITYSDFFNNIAGNFLALGSIPAGLGEIITVNANGDSCDLYYNIYEDPLFVDPVIGDYHLQAESPCIDAGDPNSPLDPDSTIADIGAFYFDQTVWVGNYPQPSQINEFYLQPNYPNPFNPITTISFSLPKASHVKLTVYDLQGRAVTELVNGMREASVHTVTWDASHLTSGIYLYRLNAGQFTASGKMVLLK